LVGCVPSSGSGEHPAERLASVEEGQLSSETEPAAAEVPPVAGLVSAAEQGLPPELQALDEAWTGDLDGMQERRVVRVLTAFAKGLYFLDGAVQRGATYEMVKMFEEEINEKLDTGLLKLNVLIIPVTRDRLLPALADGYGDIAAANLTITPERLELVDFADPFLTGVDEIVVTGPTAPELASLDDLAGQELLVRPSSSYYESLVRLNERFRAEGKAEVVLAPADEYLEDEDLLEMVNAGLLPMVVVDSTKAEFWSQIFDDLEPRPNLTVNTGGEIAWALRKDSPQLRDAVNEFVPTHRQGTLMGNIVLNRYLRDTNWIRNSLAATDMERFESMVGYFQRYADQYDFDWLMVAAQAYQESRLDQSVRSRVGAIGVMQILPATAADPNVGIPDIEVLENNIHAGTKYLRFMRDRYFADDGLDDLNATLLSFAGYNGGPNRIARLRDETAQLGLDPNVWFDNVELVVSKRIGRETVQYVSNIYKYYVAYRLIADRIQLREAA
jgi:membrane-bound lytic murein transglycosylase MltF